MATGNRANIVLVILLVAIGALAFLWLSSFLHGSRRKSPRIRCLNNLKQIGALCVHYADDHDGQFPYDPSVNPRAFVAFQYLVDSHEHFDFRVLVSPVQTDTPAGSETTTEVVLGPENVSYAYRGRPTTDSNFKKELVLAANDTYRGAPNEGARPEGHRGGVNAVLITGEARFFPAGRWAADRSFPVGLVDNYGNGE